MLTGNGENKRCFDGKNGAIDAFIWVWRWPDENRHKILFFEDNFLFLILWKSQRQRLNNIEGFRGILLLVKFNRLVFSFVNFVVSLQAEIFNGTAFWRKTIYGKEVVFLYKFSYYYSLLSSGFKPLKIEANQWFLIKNTGIRYLYPSLQQDDYNNLNILSQEICLLVLKKHSDIENLKINTKRSILLVI
jgi:hypothetical protein